MPRLLVLLLVVVWFTGRHRGRVPRLGRRVWRGRCDAALRVLAMRRLRLGMVLQHLLLEELLLLLGLGLVRWRLVVVLVRLEHAVAVWVLVVAGTHGGQVCRCDDGDGGGRQGWECPNDCRHTWRMWQYLP